MKITELSKLSLEIAVKSTLSNKSGLSIIMSITTPLPIKRIKYPNEE